MIYISGLASSYISIYQENTSPEVDANGAPMVILRDCGFQSPTFESQTSFVTLLCYTATSSYSDRGMPDYTVAERISEAQSWPQQFSK